MYTKYKDYSPKLEYGIYPTEREMDLLLKYGSVIVDKIAGPTSQTISTWVKEILRVKKAGHVGTLDPNVTGVLPILLNKTNKLMSFLHSLPKEYVVLMKLHELVDEEVVKKTVLSFKGIYEHTPPRKSAVKRVKRKRKIYDIEVLEQEAKYVLFKVRAESGTYMRTLCIDIGKKLGIKAHMQELRRVESAGFKEDMAVDLYTLKEYAYLYYDKGKEDYLRDIIVPMERYIKNYPKIIVKESAALSLLNGSPLYVKGIYKIDESIKEKDVVALISTKGELLAFGESLLSFQQIKKNFEGIAVKPLSVIMDKEDYKKE